MKYKLVNPNYEKDYVISLLESRQVEDIDLFINPNSSLLSLYDGLENIEEGYELIRKAAREENKKILIIVDSDIDGFTSAAIMYSYLRDALGVKAEYWLHSGKQHGLEDHIDRLMDTNNEYSLVIVPDAGSNDYEHHERLKEINLPVLVIDHHLVDKEISDNAVIINNQSSEFYKNKDLTGAGVVLQFCIFLDSKFGDCYSEEYFDLAALGIVGDMGNMLSMENRYIVSRGLNDIRNFFFRTLVDKQSYSMGGKVTPITVAFYIVPLINAMIRVGTQDQKERVFEAFIDGEKLIPSQKRGSKGIPEKVAIESVRECINAQALQRRIRSSAMPFLESKINKEDLLENEILFIKLEKEEEDVFPVELTGLMAMQLAAKFSKPTIITRIGDDGVARGSIRGINGSELESFKNFLEESGLPEYVSGHDQAAGIGIKVDRIESLHNYAHYELSGIDFGENHYEVNFIRSANSEDLAQLINEIAEYDDLWGQNNPTPRILITDIHITSKDYRVMGKNSDTVKFSVNGVDYIKFFAKEFIEELEEFEFITLKIVGKATINEWMGRYSPQIIVEDYDVEDGEYSF